MKFLKIFSAIAIILLFSCNQNKESEQPQSKEFLELQKKKTEKQKELEKLKEEIKKLKAKKDSMESAGDSI